MSELGTPKGYWVARVDVHDPEGYHPYTLANGPVIAAHGGRFLVRAGNFKTMEGDSRARNVVVEFPSFDAAQAAYYDPAYQAAIDLRRPYSQADLVILEGVSEDLPPVEPPGVPGYWIMRISLRNPQGYRAHAEMVGDRVAAFGGVPVARGGRIAIVEGTARGRNVIIRFPDVHAAVECYHSPAYQQAIPLRQAVAETDFIIISGYDGPQPG